MEIGLYLHIPFCVSKCPYCDFYSYPCPDEETLERYTDGLCAAMDRWAERLGAVTADTVYFGGGTPSLLGGERIARLLEHADRRFSLTADAEITLEANPADDLYPVLRSFAAAGGNRLSMGMQSAVPEELRRLGRRHTPADAERAVRDARRAGIENISLDLMLGISGQTVSSVQTSVGCLAALGATHASAYLLKLEPGTPYGACPPPLPDDDTAAQFYEVAADALESHGYRQYEISNFAVPGRESRHNLKYWDSRPYLGLGPAASSCLDGRRFTYPRDTAAFLTGVEPLTEPDEQIPTGSPAEYALLRLRLTDGLTAAGFRERFSAPIPAAWIRRAGQLPSTLVIANDGGIRLTRAGFLLSNSLIGHILEE